MIGAIHQFHDQDYSQDWAHRFEATGERKRLFTDIGDHLQATVSKEPIVLELGIGPGHLAHYLMERLGHINYIGLDFSQAMLDIAGERLKPHEDRLKLVQADLIKDEFKNIIPKKVDAIVSTWALHDLGSSENTRRVYEQSATILKGIFINGDFIKPEGIGMDYEGGRFEIDQHLRMLWESGYEEVSCKQKYETNLDAPTAANNYVCLVGYRN